MNADTRSYECEELNDCSECEDPHCACDCHDDQVFNAFLGWVRLDEDEL